MPKEKVMYCYKVRFSRDVLKNGERKQFSIANTHYEVYTGERKPDSEVCGVLDCEEWARLLGIDDFPISRSEIVTVEVNLEKKNMKLAKKIATDRLYKLLGWNEERAVEERRSI